MAGRWTQHGIISSIQSGGVSCSECSTDFSAFATTFAASAVAPVAPTASFAPASFACAAAFRFASSARACLPR